MNKCLVNSLTAIVLMTTGIAATAAEVELVDPKNRSHLQTELHMGDPS